LGAAKGRQVWMRLRSTAKIGQNRHFLSRLRRLRTMPPMPAASRQLLLCLASGQDSPLGRLQRFTRLPAGGWVADGAMVPVTLGRAGLAWGRGLHPAMPDRQKCEGDGRSPAGIFAVTARFGLAEPGSTLANAAKLPCLRATRDLKCIDDPASANYNRIVDQTAIARPDWVSCEDMLRGDGRYAVGAVVGHNCDPVVAGAGSCIFLHVWEAPGMPTAGCTAMALADMSRIAAWLDGAAAPLLVQLPQAEYERRRADWDLPVFAP
jgi:L,D-peptidoglycan transpeptidase YkuD (ErfK/YbiS/YcfS/YnhG family)